MELVYVHWETAAKMFLEALFLLETEQKTKQKGGKLHTTPMPFNSKMFIYFKYKSINWHNIGDGKK